MLLDDNGNALRKSDKEDDMEAQSLSGRSSDTAWQEKRRRKSIAASKNFATTPPWIQDLENLFL